MLALPGSKCRKIVLKFIGVQLIFCHSYSANTRSKTRKPCNIKVIFILLREGTRSRHQVRDVLALQWYAKVERNCGNRDNNYIKSVNKFSNPEKFE